MIEEDRARAGGSVDSLSTGAGKRPVELGFAAAYSKSEAYLVRNYQYSKWLKAHRQQTYRPSNSATWSSNDSPRRICCNLPSFTQYSGGRICRL